MTTTKTLNSGTVVDLDPVTGIVTFRTCTWLVRVASNDPEPTSFADTFRDVDCGARLHGDERLCEAHQEAADAPYDDWNDLDIHPGNDLSHVC